MTDAEPVNTIQAQGQTYCEDNAGPLIAWVRTHALSMLTSPDRDELFVAAHDNFGDGLTDELREGLR